MERLISKKTEDPITKEPVKFVDINDVWKHVRDVVGIRIALYSYHHHREVEALIADEFMDCYVSRTYDEASAERGEDGGCGAHRRKGRQMSGRYKGKHFQVKFKPLAEFVEKEIFVEIQLQPIHLQAWQDIEHDLIYKELNGKPSRDEKLMLDVICDHQLESERLFQKLLLCYDERVANDRKPIASIFSLAKIVEEHGLSLERPAGDKEMSSMLRLHDFLRVVEMDNKRSLDKQLQKLVHQFGSGPVGPEERFLPGLQVERLPAVRIMGFILSQLDDTPAVLESATKRARAGLLEDTYRLKVVLSAIVWLHELFVDLAVEKKQPGTLSQMMRDLYCDSGPEEKEGVLWAFRGSPEPGELNSRAKVLENRSIEGQNARYPRLLWEWFEGLSEKSNCQIFDFVFQISKMGVFVDFVDDCRKLSMYRVEFSD